MSARRDTVGVAIAPVRRVAVTNQDALSAVVPSNLGNCGRIGRRRVCCSETTIPHSESVVTIRAGPPLGRRSRFEAGRVDAGFDMAVTSDAIGFGTRL
jgi:hypothetical protein